MSWTASTPTSTITRRRSRLPRSCLRGWSTPGRRCWRLGRSRRRRRRRRKSRKTMSLKDKTLKLCSCNKTIALDAAALGSALKSGSPITVHTELCRKEAGQFQAALGDETLLRSEEHTSELQSHVNLVCRLLLEK